MSEAAAFPRTHNLPSLAEQLAEEVWPLKTRATRLAEAAAKSTVINKNDYDDACTLGVMIGDHIKEVESARKIRKEPFLADGRLVDINFNNVIDALAIYDAKGKVVDGPLFDLRGKVRAYIDEQGRLAEIERKRLEGEARMLREAAEQAETDRLAMLQSGDTDGAMQSEIIQRKAEIAADQITQLADNTAFTPVANSYGMAASKRTTKKVVITDFAAALKHAVKINKDTIFAAVQAVYERQLKAKVTTLPGAEIKEVFDVSFRG